MHQLNYAMLGKHDYIWAWIPFKSSDAFKENELTQQKEEKKNN